MAVGKNRDVIIVGSGNSGSLAALATQEVGARVLILEKAPKERRGGNTHFTGGSYRFAYKPDEVRGIIPDLSESELNSMEFEGLSQDQFYGHIMRITEGRANPEMVELLVKESQPTIKWMTAQGAQWEFRPEDAAALKHGKIHVGSGVQWLRAKNRGEGLSKNLFSILEKRGIPVLYGTKVVKLLQDRRGRVCGVTVKNEEGFEDIEGKAVILACGSFEANREMRLKYLGAEWETMPIRGTRYNTGDGLRMALEIGAQTAGHWAGCHAAQVDVGAPEFPEMTRTDDTTRSGYQMGIIVNVHGKRFVDEGEDWRPFTYTKFAHEIMRQPQRMAFQVIDSKMVDHLSGRYNKGIQVKADTIEELAQKLEIDVDSLVQTVKEFNAGVQTGTWDLTTKDGKRAVGISPPKSNWAIEIDRPPFYAFPTKAALTYTFGGLKTNRKCQVLDNEDNVVPGLYAAGERVGFWHFRYMGGSGLMLGAVTGKIAGAQAGAE
ncbi:MAG: FAD-dependent tricarballylate dehydrogenase TcuA [Deltaproteobacteria bacterium]|nr:FAD-dependent tricarballylate dehydrogenase TcuA [Deltaproteobacteria bacterium]